MTCREKLRSEYPNYADLECYGGCLGCPSSYGYLDNPDFCSDLETRMDDRCTRCWDREIPENDKDKTTNTYFVSWVNPKTMAFGNGTIKVTSDLSGVELVKCINESSERISKDAVVLTIQPV